MGNTNAFERLAALCARREYCQHDMLEKMRQWGLPEEERAQVMQHLTEGRYVDDERFTRAFVNDKVRYGKWGRRKLEQALWMKRIDESIISSVLDEMDDEEYLTVLRPLVRQKLRTIRADSDYELRMKVTKWALSRGYTMDLIRQCLDAPESLDFP
jgi:regulatory protein